MKRFFTSIIKSTVVLILTIISFVSEMNAQNLLTNGDFESGGSGTGFLVTDYTLINPLTGVSTPGTYARTTDPILMNSNYISGGDHTTGSGFMMVYDGAASGSRFFWTTGSTGGAIGGFTPGTTYTFSFWVKAVSNEVTNDPATRANIGAFFVNANNVNPTSLNQLIPLPEEGWKKRSYSFTATAPAVLIRLRTIGGGPTGQDFAVDDFSVTEGGLPFEGSFTTVNPTCPDSTDGSITVTATGGSLPYGSYNLTGTATATSANGIFNGLTAGTYSVSVTDAAGLVYTAAPIELIIPNDLVVSDDVTICAGESTTLTASAGAGVYTWTASPADASITDPNSATQNVSPTETTVYTVTSGVPSSTDNLVSNGDFEEGISGFTTEYAQVINPNPFGVQGSYNIVTNPNAWFSAFVVCGDHTSGTGNMMVFDGATFPGGDTRVWCNEPLINVQPNTDYTFSYYVNTVSSGVPARLEVLINDVSLGAPQLAPSNTCVWALQSFQWNSGSNTTAAICIYDREISQGGNDFALDDISFTETISCVYTKNITVTVTPQTTPTFDAVAGICAGTTLAALPTTSLNGIDGSWSPALNNLETTTYTFTPDTPTACQGTATLTIEVTAPVTPTFDAVAAVCAGDAIPALPTTSLNGIEGSWSPALNNLETTTYTFTPQTGACAIDTTLTITITSPETPTFDAVDAVCFGETIEPLPTTSLNGIVGSWSPALNNLETTTYTFTPMTGECATTTTLTVSVNALPVFSIAEGCNGLNYTLTAVESDNENTSYTWLNSDNQSIGSGNSVVINAPGSYTLIITQNGCSAEQSVVVASTLCTIQKGISPNNDGSNDFFDLGGLVGANVKIFNRYGRAVYTKSNYQNEWFGQSDNGEELPDGTYYYLVDAPNVETKTGWVYVIRENK